MPAPRLPACVAPPQAQEQAGELQTSPTPWAQRRTAGVLERTAGTGQGAGEEQELRGRTPG